MYICIFISIMCIHAYITYLCLMMGPRNNNTSVRLNALSAQSWPLKPFRIERNQGSIADSRAGVG